MANQENLYTHLEQHVLRMDSRFCTEDGHLLKNKVVEAALALDPALLRYLLQDDKLKLQFFTIVPTHSHASENSGETIRHLPLSFDGDSAPLLVFDKVKFQRFVMNKQFLPDSYTSFKNKIGLVNENGEFLSESREVVLSWPYKDCMLEGGQTKEDAKRDEIFWNETLAPDEINRLTEPKAFTTFRRYDSTGEHEVSEIRKDDNLIIKGNNLLALYSLRKRFRNSVKLIYIDPPFNTSNDSFSYNDSFTRSTWLTFMRNRLEVARDLLTPDGNIFIHIDINQSHYLKTLCDEVFQERNFVEEIIWAYGSPSGGRAASAKPVNIHDYILHYCKNYGTHAQKHVYIPYSEKYIADWFKYVDEDGRRYQKRQRGYNEDGTVAWEKQYLDDSKGIPLSTVWADIKQVYANPMAYKSGNTADMEVIKQFKGGQKPESLIARIIDMCTDENDIVLDFHLGTGTTAATAHKKNRRYIGVEQMDSQIEIIITRLQKVIRGETAGISKSVGWQPQNPDLLDGDKYAHNSFLYMELAQAGQRWGEEIEKVGSSEGIPSLTEKDGEAQECHTTTLRQIWQQMQQKGFMSYKVKPNTIDEHATEFEQLSLDDQKRFLIECLDKNILYVPFDDMDDSTYQMTEHDKQLTRQFYALR